MTSRRGLLENFPLQQNLKRLPFKNRRYWKCLSYSYDHQSQNYAIKTPCAVIQFVPDLHLLVLHQRIPDHLISNILNIQFSQSRPILLILSSAFPPESCVPLCSRRIHRQHFPPHRKPPLIQSTRTACPPPYCQIGTFVGTTWMLLELGAGLQDPVGSRL
jgi:hypothetical protein